MPDQFQPNNENPVSNKIEDKVRRLIGDLEMQVIILRSAIEAAQEQERAAQLKAQNTPRSPQPDRPIVPPAPSQPEQPVPPSGPRPIPQDTPTPQPQQPDVNPDRRANGQLREVNS